MPATSSPALLLVNLGTPDAPTAAAVKRYLAEFLHDHRVVQLTRWLWCPLLHGVILPLRSPKVAHKYAEVWMDGGSPLLVHTRALADAVQARLPGWRVQAAMRYGQPSLKDAFKTLAADGTTQVHVLPLYPQYSTTTTASVEDIVVAARTAHPQLRIQVLPDYHVDAAWVAAVATSIRTHWQQHGRAERLLLSYHGIPQRLVDAGDPYARQCEASTAAIKAALGSDGDAVWMAYQSRFGREQWLQPYTQATLEEWGRAGVRQVDVVCPGFAVDCLETLEEIALQNAQAFRDAGGQQLRYIPCLNASDAHADALAGLVRDIGTGA